MNRAFLPRSLQKRLAVLVFAVLAMGITALGQHFGWFAASAKTAQNADPSFYVVNHFVDGDTIAVTMDGKVEKVRFIGVDTPETHKPNTPVQCFGPEAAARAKQLIGSQRVRLEADSQSTNRDRYDRLLRYVYLPDGTNVNETLIKDGYAFYYPYFPFTKATQFAADQQAAQTEHRGLWAACTPSPTDGGGYVSNNAS
ncbi:MAG TPA: thermonuclease family protein [Candidatus Saccharimonadales bacterium]|nr:thermonuclease family protein [Candidatus Saccharimonadales bacterium]